MIDPSGYLFGGNVHQAAAALDIPAATLRSLYVGKITNPTVSTVAKIPLQPWEAVRARLLWECDTLWEQGIELAKRANQAKRNLANHERAVAALHKERATK